jgi:hypothetical protein
MDTIILVAKRADKLSRYKVMIEGGETILGSTRLPFYEGTL